MSKVCLVTGSSGLIGSEVAVFFHARGFAVPGVDNNQRETFFGPQGNTRWNQPRLVSLPCRLAAKATGERSGRDPQNPNVPNSSLPPKAASQ